MTYVSLAFLSQVHEWQMAEFCSIERSVRNMLDIIRGVHHINGVLAGGSSPVLV